MKPRIAINLMLSIVAFVTIFHFSILLKIIPYDIAWGGQLKNDTEMYVFEAISIIINFILGLVLLVEGNYIKQFISTKATNIILWIFFVLFGLNTVGNIFAKTNFEKFFAIVTLLLSILIWIILKSKNEPANR